MQFEVACPPDGKAHIIRLDLPDLEQRLLFTAESPSFSSVTWDKPDELRLFDGAQEWRYNFNSQELKPGP
jgi:hypothetical protein